VGIGRSDHHPSLYRARTRLGEEVLATLFRQVAGPLATPDTPGSWWRGLRLLALEGTLFDVPDSFSNAAAFDGPSTGGTPFGFPQVRAVFWRRSARTRSWTPPLAGIGTANGVWRFRWPAPPSLAAGRWDLDLRTWQDTLWFVRGANLAAGLA
jgi:hypothetical protein